MHCTLQVFLFMHDLTNQRQEARRTTKRPNVWVGMWRRVLGGIAFMFLWK